ncbi:uncharacterized protein [Linepithema humile]|uniref:uncharacterized protein n=1 Tax=Linepithema humile TaxID=83485 RepID=UPI00351F5BF0
MFRRNYGRSYTRGKAGPKKGVLPTIRSFLYLSGNDLEKLTYTEKDTDVIKSVEIAEASKTLDKPDSGKVTEEPQLDLDESLLLIMGDEPPASKEELKVHSSIAKRWGPWFKTSMKKEEKEELCKKYPRAGSFSLEAPILNEELTRCLKESALKRDKYFSITQNLVGTALAALVPTITTLITSNTEDSKKALTDAWNSARILVEIHRSQTIARRACILPSLSKPFAEALEKREADTFLFGEKLGEKINQLKSVDKLGREIKLQFPKKPTPQTKQLNWKSPSVSQNQKPTPQTGYKSKPPQKSSAHKTSSRQNLSYPRSSHYRHRDYRFRHRS